MIPRRDQVPLFALLGFAGVFLDTVLFMLGLFLASPVVAALALCNVPVWTAVLAHALGIEAATDAHGGMVGPSDHTRRCAGASRAVGGAWRPLAVRHSPTPCLGGFPAAALARSTPAVPRRQCYVLSFAPALLGTSLTCRPLVACTRAAPRRANAVRVSRRTGVGARGAVWRHGAASRRLLVQCRGAAAAPPLF